MGLLPHVPQISVCLTLAESIAASLSPNILRCRITIVARRSPVCSLSSRLTRVAQFEKSLKAGAMVWRIWDRSPTCGARSKREEGHPPAAWFIKTGNVRKPVSSGGRIHPSLRSGQALRCAQGKLATASHHSRAGRCWFRFRGGGFLGDAQKILDDFRQAGIVGHLRQDVRAEILHLGIAALEKGQ